MQPFSLRPALKDAVWGGARLKNEFGKATDLTVVAESWELSAHPHGSSIIADGPLAGISLLEFFNLHKPLCGTACQSLETFPILVKLIDAAEALSIQVHPDDAYARLHEGEPGKTEMWLVLDHDPGAFLYIGFSRPVSMEEMERRIADNTLEEVLQKVPVKKNDVFFLRAGTIHAINAGILVAEVQQSSDSTYRVYDYGRPGADSKPRALHVQKALDVTERAPANFSIPGSQAPQSSQGLHCLAHCPFFTVQRLSLNGAHTQTLDGSSFLSVLCLDGSALLGEGSAALSLGKGDSAFVPADNAAFSLTGKGEFLFSSFPGSQKS